MDSRDRSEWVIFSLILFLAAVLRLYRLGAEGYWLDEVFSLQQAPSSLWSVITEFWSFEGSSRPLGLAPLSLTLHFGESEFLTRLPYAILSVADVAAIYFVARKIARPGTAYLAMAFLALSPLHVWYAQEVRWYSQWCLLTTLSFLALFYAWESDRRAAWVGYVAATVLSLYTFVLSIFVVIAHVFSTWLLALQRNEKRFVVKQHLLVLLAFLLALPTFTTALGFNPAEAGSVVGTPRARSLAELPYNFFVYVVGFSLGPTIAELHRTRDLGWIFGTYPEVFGLAVIIGALFGVALWSLGNNRQAAAILLPWAFGLPLLVFTVSMVTGQTFNVRYALPGLSGFIIFLAIGTQSFSRRTIRYLAVGVVILVFTFSLTNYYWNPRYDKEDVRGAVEMMSESPFAEVPVAFIGQGAHVAQYYGPYLDIRDLLSCDGSPGSPVSDDIEKLRTEPSFWLMASRDWSYQSSRCLKVLKSTHRVSEHNIFVGVELWRFERAEEADLGLREGQVSICVLVPAS